MDNPRRNTLVLCEDSCWDTCLGERRHWQWGQKLTWASSHIAKITLCCIFKESIIALHILSEQTNAAFDTQANRSGTRMREDQEWTNMFLPQTYSPPSLVDSVEEKNSRGNRWRWTWSWNWLWSARSALWWRSVCSEDTVYQCASCIHCMYSFCFLRERSLFTAGGGGGGGLAKLVAPPKIAPPLKNAWNTWETNLPPPPWHCVKNFVYLFPPPPPPPRHFLKACLYVSEF